MHNSFIPCNQPPKSLLFPASPLKSSKYHFKQIGETHSMIHPEAKFLSSCETEEPVMFPKYNGGTERTDIPFRRGESEEE